MSNQSEKTIAQIENRLQFVVTLNVFFVTLMYGISILAGNTESISQNSSIQGSLIVFFYLLNYVVFEIWGKKMKEKGLKWINGSVLAGIACFVVPILFIALSTAKSQPVVPAWIAYIDNITLTPIFMASLYGLFIVPLLILGLIIFWPKEKAIK